MSKHSRSAGKRRSSTVAKESQLRIIAGQWRGRKISFSGTEGLRPTGDRLRETLFNWLAPDIVGARCVDLFAGSGALGLEALSRGAAACQFVDSHPQSCRSIQAALSLLECDTARVQCATAEQWLARQEPVDVVFFDPPFSLPECYALLLDLPANTLIYVEAAKGQHHEVPATWRVLKDKTLGSVNAKLYQS